MTVPSQSDLACRVRRDSRVHIERRVVWESQCSFKPLSGRGKKNGSIKVSTCIQCRVE